MQNNKWEGAERRPGDRDGRATELESDLTAATAKIAELEGEMAKKQELLDHSRLQCLNCNAWCPKGARLVAKTGEVYCSYECAETDGASNGRAAPASSPSPTWAQK